MCWGLWLYVLFISAIGSFGGSMLYELFQSRKKTHGVRKKDEDTGKDTEKKGFYQ